MTVITMPSSEKKSDNVPLVDNIEIDPASSQAKDLEAGNVGADRSVRSRFLILRVINDRVYSIWAVAYILLMSLLITIMMLYGETIYKAIGRAFQEEDQTYYGTHEFAVNDKLSAFQNLNNDLNEYDESNQLIELKQFQMLTSDLNTDDVISEMKTKIQEQVEENYENIVSNSARFIHDFSANVTGIVDVVGQRCFIMPLNRTAVVPPSSLYDLLFKMSSGYYTVDTTNVMHNMRMVKPAVKDFTPYGAYIAKDCANYPTFKLEKIISGVFKRSVLSSGKVFSEFVGKSDSFNIVNYYEAV
ncbi:Hypothetical protein CINCED_3A010682 [Cinara cedri]|uniref:Integral membrane protein 2 n=1 Tax=Cinara cedri TaxID=506608 RepID=A0A5E4NLQ9_9HEMI|nr:Hypothetical protein CINCED_3A010682 [Cinara cedri]